jgi:hypothetical protein
MRNRIYASVVALAFAVTGSAFAAGTTGSAPMCESVFGAKVDGNGSTTSGAFGFGQGNWSLGANAAYHHLFFDPIQLGGTVSLGVGDSGGATTYQISALVGPTFNFMNSTAGDISDAVFVFAGVGLNLQDQGAGSSTDFQFGAEVGKRFKVWDNISYRPSFGFRKVGSAGLLFSANLINISVLY